MHIFYTLIAEFEIRNSREAMRRPRVGEAAGVNFFGLENL
jgi:hypothetical protein